MIRRFWWSLLLAGITTACGNEPAGCTGAECTTQGYAIVRGEVLQANGSPYFVATQDAVLIRCGFAPDTWGAGESTDRTGQYRFDLEPTALTTSHLQSCIISAGTGANLAADTINVNFAVSRAQQSTFVVNLRLR